MTLNLTLTETAFGAFLAIALAVSLALDLSGRGDWLLGLLAFNLAIFAVFAYSAPASALLPMDGSRRMLLAGAVLYLATMQVHSIEVAVGLAAEVTEALAIALRRLANALA